VSLLRGRAEREDAGGGDKLLCNRRGERFAQQLAQKLANK